MESNNQKIILIKDRFFFLSNWWLEDLYNGASLEQEGLQLLEHSLWLIGRCKFSLEGQVKTTLEISNKINEHFLELKNSINSKSEPSDQEIQQIEAIENIKKFYDNVLSDYAQVESFFDERIDDINAHWKIYMKKLENILICSVGSPRLWLELWRSGRHIQLSQNIKIFVQKLFIKKLEHEQHSYNRLSFWFHKVAVSCMLVRYPNNNFDKIKFVNTCQIDQQKRYITLNKKAYIIDNDDDNDNNNNNNNNINNNSSSSTAINITATSSSNNNIINNYISIMEFQVMDFLPDMERYKTYDRPLIFWTYIGQEIENNWSQLAKIDDDFDLFTQYETEQEISERPSLRMSIGIINEEMQCINECIQNISQIITVNNDYSQMYVLINQIQYRYNSIFKRTKIILNVWKNYLSPEDLDMLDLGRNAAEYDGRLLDVYFSPYKNGIDMINNERYKKIEEIKDIVVQVLFGIFVDFIIILVCTEIIAFVYSQIIVEDCPGFSIDILIGRLLRAASFITNIDTTLESENDY